ncbi:MAG: hypothetical protein V4613_13200 [Bacteroidota bacterium]
MKKLLIILVALPFFSADAQRNSLWISSGYNYGIAKNINEVDMNWGTPKKYSLGSGTSTQLYFQHQPDSSNWTIGAGTNILIGNRNLAGIKENKGDSSVKSATLTSNSLRFFIQLGYAWQIKKLQFQLNAGITIPALTTINGEINTRDSFKSSVEKFKINNYFSIGFKGSFSVRYKIKSRILLFLMLDQQILNAKVRKKSTFSYSGSDGSGLNDAYPNYSDRESVYMKNVEDIRNNKAVLPTAFNKDKATESLSYSQSYSSLGLQLGFQFLF